MESEIRVTESRGKSKKEKIYIKQATKAWRGSRGLVLFFL
jgi:hypothetical protein